MHFINFPVDPTKAFFRNAPHSSIDQARRPADADGTRSILDIDAIGDTPDFCTAAPLDDSVLQNLYQTAQPTRQMIESNMDFLEDVERRPMRSYIVVYKKTPSRRTILRGLFVRLSRCRADARRPLRHFGPSRIPSLPYTHPAFNS